MADTQQKTLLDQVREQSCVDCDTLDVEGVYACLLTY